MRSFVKFTRGTVALSVALVVCFAATLRAEEAAPVPMATLTAKSLDAAAALAKEVGVELPPFLTAAGIEEQFSFIGKGGMSSDRPIGIIFFGAPGVQPQQLVTFVLPVKAGAATLDSFKALGGQPMAGHADTIVLNGQVGLRRTGDYLIFSPNALAATTVNVDEFAAAMKSADALAKLSVDMKGVRSGMPEVLKGALENIEKGANESGDEIGKRAGASVARFAKEEIESINRIDVALDAGAEHARLSVAVTPVKIPAVAAANRPGMPTGVIARVDVGVSYADLFPAMRDVLPSFMNSIIDKDEPEHPHTAEEKAKMRDLVKRVLALEMEPATSFGFEVIAGTPVVYIVQHWSKPMDVPNEIREISGALNTLIQKEKEKNHLSVQTYEAEGQKVLHVVAMEKEKPIGCLDILQRGNDVFMTISPSLEHHMQTLANAPQEGAMKDLVSGTIDIGGFIDALGTIPESPLAQMPPEQKKQLSEIFHGRKVHIGLSSHGDTATFEVKFDRALLQKIGNLVKGQ